MDDIAAYNMRRWQALAAARAVFTRPAVDLDAAAARAKLDPDGWLGALAGTRVLCLASGGGQQSAAFALLGAEVTVVDLSEAQLERDRAMAARYHVAIAAVQGDMRDLSRFEAAAFDLVWQPYSLNFVPDARAVFQQVARVLRRGGLYHVQCTNPFVCGLTTADWNGEGYTLKRPYLDGAPISYDDEPWVYDRIQQAADGEQSSVASDPTQSSDEWRSQNSSAAQSSIPGPREYRHTLSTVINGLTTLGFVIRRVSDSWSMSPDPSAPPGTWDHLVAFAPPWLAFWASYQPEADRRLITPQDSASDED